MILHNGDCLEFMRTLPDNSVDMCLTDPPYGTTACKWDSIILFEPMWVELKRIVKDNGAIVLFSNQPFTSALIMSNVKMFKYEWIWNKGQGTGFLNSKKQPLRNTENIVVFYKKQPVYIPEMRTGFKHYICKQGEKKTENYGKQNGAITVSNGERFPLNLIAFNRDKEKLHPTQKPVALLEYLIKTYTIKNETVLDFTMGSGSTGVACVNTKRSFIGCELDESYFNIALERINGRIG